LVATRQLTAATTAKIKPLEMAGRELLLVSGLKSDSSRLRFHSSGYGAADKPVTNSAVSSGLVRDGQGSEVQIHSRAKRGSRLGRRQSSVSEL